MQHYIVFILFYLIILYIGYREIKRIQTTESKNNQKYLYSALAILLFGCILRTVYLTYPYDINADEAMAAYDAWCLSNFGVDQYLMSYPAYFKSWGSGQNALYTYMMLPFIKVFGMHPYILRIPMALLSCSSILLLYFTIRKIKLDSFNILMIVLIFTLTPWHIMKSRWGLESNVAPDLLLIATCLIIYASVAKKVVTQTVIYILAFVFFALSAYGYSSAWFMIPFYVILVSILIIKKHFISIKQLIISGAIMLVIVAPLLIFTYILISKGTTITLGIFTIPELVQSRHEATTIFSRDASEILEYFLTTIKMLFLGDDGNLYNSLPLCGQFFNPIGWIFIAIGAYSLKKKKNYNILDRLFILWLIATIPLLISVEYNVNRWNVIWFPLLYFCAKGLYVVLNENKKRQIIFYAIFSILFIFFSIKYVSRHSRGFRKEIGTHIEFIKTIDVDSIYYSEGWIEHSIIYFYDPMDPYELVRTQVHTVNEAGFTRYPSFGKYHSNLPENIKPVPRVAYIIPNYILPEYKIDTTAFKKMEGRRFTTFWND